MKIFVSAPRGTTGLLEQELRACGVRNTRAVAAGVHGEAELEAIYRTCLWSRVANRVLLPLASFPAGNTDELYDGAKAFDWPKLFPVTASFAVHCTLARAAIDHSHFASLRVKDAIVDRFRDDTGERPSVDTDNPAISINVHIRQREAQVSLDLSGGSLHRRGYREAGGEAPLKENLAAALLLFAGWPSQQALFDPVCGSGTLLIEGAMMVADYAPGLLREQFGFEHWSGHDQQVWRGVYDDAVQRRDAGLQVMPPIRGHDADRHAIRKAIGNITRAGLQQVVHAETCELSATGSLPAALTEVEQGLLICNPPYGERIQAKNGLRELHAAIGKLHNEQLPGWHTAVFTASPDLVLYQGQVADAIIELNNGPLECELFLYRDTNLLEQIGAPMFANRLQKNMKKFSRWAKREEISCFRVYDADLPEFAVAIDLYYADELYIHVQEYQAPKTIDPLKALQRLQAVFAMLPGVLGAGAAQTSYRSRRRQQGKEQYQRLGGSGDFHEVREGPCRLYVNFSDYLDTGLFLDHRTTRRMLGEMSQNKRVLNLFCYTATATLQAIAGGAIKSVSVDMSNTYLEWAEKNFALNRVDTSKHELVRADCMEWLGKAGKWKQKFDVIFIDPPTFSNSKRMDKEFDVQRDHVALLKGAEKILAHGGVILFSNNFRKFKLDEKALQGLKVEDISQATIPDDFQRRQNIHRCWKITRA